MVLFQCAFLVGTVRITVIDPCPDLTPTVAFQLFRILEFSTVIGQDHLEQLLKKPDGIATRGANFMLPRLGWALRIMNRFPRLIFFHLPMIHHSRIIKPVLGMKMSLGRYIEIGERGYNMERLVNSRFGISAESDTLPKRLTDVPQDPARPDTRVPLERMKKTYYRARGWDKNGIPTEKTLRRLKIK